MLRQVVSGLRGGGQTPAAALALPQLLSRDFAKNAPPSKNAPAGKEVKQEDILPPTPVHGIAGRYATALYMSAAKAGLLSEINSDLKKIGEAAVESQELKSFLKDPSIPRGTKQDALNTILDQLKAKDITKNFFALLNENRRLGEFMKISTTYEELVAAAKGEVLANITLAERIDQKEVNEIVDSLKSLLKKGETLSVQVKVDPAIIGGVIIDIGDKHMDLSIASRIKRIQQLILESAV